MNEFFFKFLFFDLGGKRDEKLILPTNDSISGTLSTDQVIELRPLISKLAFEINVNNIRFCSYVQKQQLQLIRHSRKIKCG